MPQESEVKPDFVCPKCFVEVASIVWAVACEDGVALLPPWPPTTEGHGPAGVDGTEFGCVDCGWHGSPAATSFTALLAITGTENMEGFVDEIESWISSKVVITRLGMEPTCDDIESIADWFEMTIDDESSVDMWFPLTAYEVWDAARAAEASAEEARALAAEEAEEYEASVQDNHGPGQEFESQPSGAAAGFFGDSSAAIRIPSASGAAIILTPVPWIENLDGVATLTRLVDITILESTRFVCYRRRRFSEADWIGLLDFLNRAMIEDFPEAAAVTFAAPAAGLQLSIPLSTAVDVDLQISLVVFLDEQIADYDQMRFTTQRAALWEPVQVLRERAETTADMPSEFDQGDVA